MKINLKSLGSIHCFRITVKIIMLIEFIVNFNFRIRTLF